MCAFASVCTASGMLCVAPQTHRVNAHAAFVFTCRYSLPMDLSLSLSPPQLFLKSRAEVFISRSNPNSRYPCPKDQREEASGGVCLVWVKPGSSPGPVYILCLQPPAAQVTSASHNSSSASSLHMLINSIYI